MSSDKKKAGGRLKFALPRCPGQVTWGVDVTEADLMNILEEMTLAG
jgi:3-dehydroquinate synthetase